MRGKGVITEWPFLNPMPPASSVYVHVLEAPSPLKRSTFVVHPFPYHGRAGEGTRGKAVSPRSSWMKTTS